MISTLSVAPNDWFGLLSRLLLALFLGGVIGWERERKNKPAGLRTHILVSFAAALFVMVPIVAGAVNNGDSISRVIQGVAAGVGFLGAGEIVTSSGEHSRSIPVRGLTSAAAIWASAALGVTAGCGLWQLGLMSAFLCFLVLRVLKKSEVH
ncbi:MgtC/SapB family protein [Phormidium sp. LEGE 05292]|uniref:MgtC/SapB family protein n=1 Tax=[Phormidium] sp. LEGE 05292 TaxID=767427 RepID=UPI00187E95E2|nr:MgtC/SapB family protein [Phormidium sp. LEGE 05292]MBE9228117.1 MgtC/SapB family protein [Phormidium sp. LEGE 05292]